MGPRPNKTRKYRQNTKAIAVFRDKTVEGEVVLQNLPKNRVEVHATFTKLPPGKHGFHIHTAGDLRGEGCKGLCAHYHSGPSNTSHGDEPRKGVRKQRHTGDLGNIELPSSGPFTKQYILSGTSVQDLWGRSIIVHADEDDLGYGDHDDSKITGHSGARLACAILGRGN
jgi:Cu-Zn family superoxide dismutase